MESVTTDQCSWCHRSFTSATSELTPAAQEPAPEAAVQTAVSEPEPPVDVAVAALETAPVRTTPEPVEARTPWASTPPALEPIAPTTADDNSEAGISVMPIIPLKRPLKKSGPNIPA